MCMFSARQGAAVQVAGTRIYARVDQDRQCIAYAMRLGASDDVAMILPVPVMPGSGEHALTFVDLSGYPRLFEDLAASFPSATRGFGGPVSRRAPVPQAKLVVHEVGAFVASFVPSIPDFARLDPRFRLPEAVWAQLPGYADWGFAVFQLKRGAGSVHPMAFHFWTRDRERVFFPTVHVHDGEVHARAGFDHELYWQGPQAPHLTDQTTPRPLPEIHVARAQGLLLGAPAHRRIMRGSYLNQDVWIGGDTQRA
jgi:hypothetical protein